MTSSDLLPALARLVPADRLLTRPGALAAYRIRRPDRVSRPPESGRGGESQDEVVEIVRLCHAARVPFMARGSGTSLSGGAVPIEDGIVIALNRLNRFVRFDADRRVAVVEPGVVNLAVSDARCTVRPLLRAGSIQSVGLHDWRQRGVQLRRRPLLPPRHDRQSRARYQGGAGRRQPWSCLEETASSTRAPISPVSSSARRDCSVSPSRSRCGSCNGRRSTAPCWPRTPHSRPPATRCRA